MKVTPLHKVYYNINMYRKCFFPKRQAEFPMRTPAHAINNPSSNLPLFHHTKMYSSLEAAATTAQLLD